MTPIRYYVSAANTTPDEPEPGLYEIGPDGEPVRCEGHREPPPDDDHGDVCGQYQGVEYFN